MTLRAVGMVEEVEPEGVVRNGRREWVHYGRPWGHPGDDAREEGLISLDASEC